MKYKILFTAFLLFFTTGLFAQTSLDLRLLEYINGPVNPGPDNAWRSFTNKATYIDAAVPVSLIIAGVIDNNDELRVKGYDVAASIIISGGAEYVLKQIVQRPRPFYAHPDVIVAKVHETDFSFPSGHASLAFATATSLSMAIPKWYVIAPSFLYASAVGYSRLYLGAHYPTDVLGGALVGIGSAYLTFKAQQWLNRKKHHPSY